MYECVVCLLVCLLALESMHTCKRVVHSPCRGRTHIFLSSSMVNIINILIEISIERSRQLGKRATNNNEQQQLCLRRRHHTTGVLYPYINCTVVQRNVVTLHCGVVQRNIMQCNGIHSAHTIVHALIRGCLLCYIESTTTKQRIQQRHITTRESPPRHLQDQTKDNFTRMRAVKHKQTKENITRGWLHLQHQQTKDSITT